METGSNLDMVNNAILDDDELFNILNCSDAELSDGDDDILNEFMDNYGDENVEVTFDDMEDNPQNDIPVPVVQPNLQEPREMKWKDMKMPMKEIPVDEILMADYKDEKDSREAFFEYFPLEFWEDVAQNTCLYSVQKRDHRSVNTAAEEMINFAGIHMMMACLRFPQMKVNSIRMCPLNELET
ncbi:uncharacterized protein LOC120349707 [Nilaparvata lugens]|uniref:uncharacterized protein LOC120349707 n=1 Tax=Nilaparvata lugens TaxID=108931 RepID=UPI00193CC1E5|nr:uncharacterized protein LOC120349707 [Nilaparvata lugens]